MSRTKTSKAWLRRHVTDAWVQKSKAEGYRARSAYKLLQIDARERLLGRGRFVVDLGAAPGGWSQVAAEAVGPTGSVIALDLLPMEPIPGVRLLQGDFESEAVLAAVTEAVGGRAVDLVLSDMAPNFTGIAAVDQLRTAALAELAVEFAEQVLSPDGAVVLKVFHGVGFDDLLKRLRTSFVRVAIRKPEASRQESSETYFVAHGLRDPGPRGGNDLGLESDQ